MPRFAFFICSEQQCDTLLYVIAFTIFESSRATDECVIRGWFYRSFPVSPIAVDRRLYRFSPFDIYTFSESSHNIYFCLISTNSWSFTVHTLMKSFRHARHPLRHYINTLALVRILLYSSCEKIVRVHRAKLSPGELFLSSSSLGIYSFVYF